MGRFAPAQLGRRILPYVVLAVAVIVGLELLGSVISALVQTVLTVVVAIAVVVAVVWAVRRL